VQNVFRTTRQDDGGGHLEIVDERFHYVFTERGMENERRVTESEDEILYWLASDAVLSEASTFEVHHRVPGQSFRRLLFAKAIELMNLMNPAWGDRKRAEIDAILSKHPFDDRVEG
jgi:hypothetical protein